MSKCQTKRHATLEENEIGVDMEDTLGVLSMMQSWRICHTRREANSVAHRLAKATVNKWWTKFEL